MLQLDAVSFGVVAQLFSAYLNVEVISFRIFGFLVKRRLLTSFCRFMALPLTPVTQALARLGEVAARQRLKVT